MGEPILIQMRKAILVFVAILGIVCSGEATEVSTTLYAVADSRIPGQGQHNSNFGSDPILKFQKPDQGFSHNLVQFSQSEIASAVGSGTLVGATMRLFIETNFNDWGSGAPIDLHRLTQAWNEAGVTWNCPNDTNVANTNPDCATQWGGGTYASPYTATMAQTNGVTGWIQWDVTADIQLFLSGTGNNGWLLRKRDGAVAGRVEYTSREGIPANTPQLVLTVNFPDGMPFSATVQSAGDSWTTGGGNLNDNHGSDAQLKFQSPGSFSHMLVRVSQSEIASIVGARPLEAATLRLFIETNYNDWGTGSNVDLHRVTQDWNEAGVTWNCPNDTNLANSNPDCPAQWSGGSYASQYTDTMVQTNGVTGWVEWDVTADMQLFLDGTANYGWLIRKRNNGSNGRIHYTSEEGSAVNTPELILEVGPLNSPPSCVATPSPGPNQYGWNNTNVTVTCSCEDPDGNCSSCLCEDPYGGPPSQSILINIEGENQAVTCTATDTLGASSQCSATVSLDKTAPTITSTQDPPKNQYGWNNEDVTVHFAAEDDRSGVLSVTPNQGIPGPGASIQVPGTATDKAGNEASITHPVSIDKTPPTITSSQDPQENEYGWNNVDVTVHFDANDDLSEVASVTPDQVIPGPGPDIAVTGTATDQADNSASTTHHVSIDKTPPTITSSQNPPKNQYGWNNVDVTVHFAADDDLSEVLTVTPDQVIPGPGQNIPVLGTATDKAGNSATQNHPVSIDKTAPTITSSQDPQKNAHGWNNVDVTVHFDANDDLSQIATVTPDQVIPGPGQEIPVPGTATDKADNSASTTHHVSIDKTPPTITSLQDPPKNQHGWNNVDVTVHFAAEDDLSDIASVTSDQVIPGPGPNIPVPGTATDLADNSASITHYVSIDKTPPDQPPTVTPAPNPAGWNKTDVTVSFDDTDNLSGVPDPPTPQTLTEETPGQIVSAEVTDAADNIGTVQIEVKIDKTAPTINASVEPPPNGNGWNNTPVTVSFPTSDNLSGAPQPEPVTRGTETDGETVSATATDLAGNQATAGVTIKIDMTPPVITSTQNPDANANGWNNTDVTVHFNATDARSGIASVTPDQLVTAEAPNQPVPGTALDNADNIATTTLYVSIDKTAPEIIIQQPDPGEVVQSSPLTVSGIILENLSQVDSLTCQGNPLTPASGAFTCDADLTSGANTIQVSAADKAGNSSSKSVGINYQSDIIPPNITITSPENLQTFGYSSCLPEDPDDEMCMIQVVGTIDDPDASVTVNRVPAEIAGSQYTAIIRLREGNNPITATAVDPSGNTASTVIAVIVDTEPPMIRIESPEEGALLSSLQLNVSGQVADLVNGVIGPTDGMTVTVNGVPAEVSNGSFIVKDLLLVRGANTIVAEATDAEGNRSTFAVQVSVGSQAGQKILPVLGDNQEAVILTQLPEPLVVALTDEYGRPAEDVPVVFEVSRGDGVLRTPSDEGSSVTAVTDQNGEAAVTYTLGSRAGTGSNRVKVTAEGYLGALEFNATANIGPPSRIAVTAGDQQRGAVGEELPLPFTVLVTDDGGNAVEGVNVTFTVLTGEGLAGDGSFNGNEDITVSTNLYGYAAPKFRLGSVEGINNNLVTASYQGQTTSSVVFTASAMHPGLAQSTTVSGLVLDGSDQPLEAVAAKIPVYNSDEQLTYLQAITDDTGKFTIQNAPVGRIHLIIEGGSAEQQGPWPTLEFNMTTVAGRDNTLGMPINLPKMADLDTDGHKIVGGVDDVTIKMEEMPGATLTVFANSVICPDGQSQCYVSFNQVNLERVPMPPPIGSMFVPAWTVQPPGTHFDPPAKVCIPNTGDPAGTQRDVYSFDHDLGDWVSVGPGTVTTDGSQICSDPGFGIVKAGWGGLPPPNPPTTCLKACTECYVNPVCENGRCGGDPRRIVSVDALGNNEEELFVDVDEDVSFTVEYQEENCTDVQILWSFADGSQSTEFAPVHSFEDPGEYDVFVAVTCGKCKSLSDIVKVKILGVDLDIDSDNNNENSDPDRSDDEDDIEDETGNAQQPGKVLFVSDGDLDADGVPDFADGITELGTEGDDASRPFVPLILEIKGVDVDQSIATVRFTYSGSDPSSVSVEGLEEPYDYTPAPGGIRLWNKDGANSRSAASLASGGNYIAPDEEISLSDLGEPIGENRWRLFAEALNVSGSVADLQVLVEVDPDGSDPEEPQDDSVRLTVINIGMVEVDPSENTTPTKNLKYSHSSPVISLTNIQITNIHLSEDNLGILGDVVLSGSVDCAVCDFTPGALGEINQLDLYVNSASQPSAAVGLTVTKDFEAPSLLKPFKMTATFSQTIPSVELQDGNNVIKLTATDKIYGNTGFHEVSIPIEGQEPPPVVLNYRMFLDFGGATSLSEITTNTPVDFEIQNLVNGLSYSGVLYRSSDTSLIFENSSVSLTLSSDLENALQPNVSGQVLVSVVAPIVAVFDGANIIGETGASTSIFSDGLVDAQVTFAAQPDPGTPDTISVSITKGLAGNISDTLSETGPDSNTYSNANSSVILTFPNGLSLDSGLEDLTDIRITSTALGIQDFDLLVIETGPQTLSFQSDNSRIIESYEATTFENWTFSAGTPEFLKASTGGEFNPYMLEVTGPTELLSLIQEIGTEDGPRKVEQAFNGRFYVKMKNSPALAFLVVWGIKAGVIDVGDSADFFLGFVKGLGNGGLELLEGVFSIAKIGVKESVRLQPISIPFVMVFGDGYRKEMDSVHDSAQIVITVGDVVLRIKQDELEFISAVLLGNSDEILRISEPYRVGLSYGLELLQAVWTQYLNSTPEEQGRVFGRIVFEIVAIVVPYAKAGSLGNLTKLEFLNTLKARLLTIGEQGVVQAITTDARLAELTAKLPTTQMCFAPGTPVHTITGLKNIEDIKKGDQVLSRDPLTGDTAYKLVTRTIVTRPTRLMHLLFRVREGASSSGEVGDASKEDQIVATPEHPFYAQSLGRFVPVGELAIGEGIKLAGGNIAELVGVKSETSGTVAPYVTYNLEVEDFHTYFVGRNGLWVHNAGRGICEQIFSLYKRIRQQPEFESPKKALEILQNELYPLDKARRLPDESMANALKEVLDAEYPGLVPWAEGPPQKWWRNLWDHYVKHVVDNRSGFPGGEFPTIHDPLTFLEKAITFSSQGPTTGEVIIGDVVVFQQNATFKIVCNKTTRELAILNKSTGEISTYYRVLPTKNLRTFLASKGARANLLNAFGI